MPVKKYLQKYAEAETGPLRDWPGNTYQRALIIPCYKESPDFLQRLMKDFAGSNLLAILVVNQPDTDKDPQANRVLLDFINRLAPPIWQQEHLNLRPWGDDCGLLLVERWREQLCIPRKQGVGLARKIGCDIGARLMADGFIAEQWLHSTDADAELPADYFHNLPCARKTSAALYPYAPGWRARGAGSGATLRASIALLRQWSAMGGIPLGLPHHRQHFGYQCELLLPGARLSQEIRRGGFLSAQ